MDKSVNKRKVNQKNSKDILKKLKCNYFLEKLFKNLYKKKTLDILKYNKNIKNRININDNDYREWCENFSSIEIKIKPVNNVFGKFINFENEDEKYYHIYFNNNEEEIKRNYIKEDEQIEIIKIIINYQIKSFKKLFEHCECIESINFKKFYRNNIIDMSYMFSKCSSLIELNLNCFNTNNVINMYAMFWECSSLKELNLKNFNTIKVIDMAGMFWKCSSLKELNLNNFDTTNVTNIWGMFWKCSSLKKLNFNFNPNNIKDIRGMFYGCSKELIKKIKTQYKDIKNNAFEEIDCYIY